MEWTSKKVTAILEAALVEDKAGQDVTTALTVDPGLRALATVTTRQDRKSTRLNSSHQR